MSASLKIFLAVAVGVLLNMSLFIVNQTEQALVLEFKRPIKFVEKPGINFKMPWQSVQYFDRRLLNFDAKPYTILAGDQKRLEVDAYLKYRISDPKKYLQSTGGAQENFESNLSTVLESSLRKGLSEVPLNALLTSRRKVLMVDLKNLINIKAKDFGIEIVDARIVKADFPLENREDIYSRMRSEREREAKNLRAQGAEEATKIKAEADKEKTILLAEAQQKAEIIKGEGDAEASKIYASAFGRDVDFYKFYRTMQAYRETIKKEDTKLILSPNNGFFRYLDKSE
jgi:membrane protease subunit HflC